MADAKAPGKWVISSKSKSIMAALILIGVAAFVFGLFKDPKRAWSSYLVSMFYFTTLALGGLFFTALQHLTKAGWSVNIRRFCESFAP